MQWKSIRTELKRRWLQTVSVWQQSHSAKKLAWHFVIQTFQLDISLAVPQRLYAIYGIAFISYLSVDHGKDHKTILQLKMELQVLLGFVSPPPIMTVLCGIPQGPISYGTRTPRTATTFSINKHTFTAPLWAGKLHVFTMSPLPSIRNAISHR